MFNNLKQKHISLTDRHMLLTHPFVVSNIADNDCFENIVKWINDNLYGEERVVVCWNNYYFTSESDAIAFKLRWA